MLPAICFILDQSKILSSGNGLIILHVKGPSNSGSNPVNFIETVGFMDLKICDDCLV